jgi:hypothetical protein
VNDFIGRESRALADGDAFAGKYKFRYCRTPHLSHCWDAGVLFEETQRTLFCSDLFQQIGDVEPLTSADVAGGSREALTAYQTGILAEHVPYTPLTGQNLKKLAALQPKTLAIMHGSSFIGNCVQVLEDIDVEYATFTVLINRVGQLIYCDRTPSDGIRVGRSRRIMRYLVSWVLILP